MAIHIENLKIEQFRGIRQLSVPHLNHINLIVGDNNCGKTSFLEALLLLRDPGDFTNTLRIARMRDSLAMYGGISAYESLLTLFPTAAMRRKPPACCPCRLAAEEMTSSIRWRAM